MKKIQIEELFPHRLTKFQILYLLFIARFLLGVMRVRKGIRWWRSRVSPLNRLIVKLAAGSLIGAAVLPKDEHLMFAPSIGAILALLIWRYEPSNQMDRKTEPRMR